MKWLALLVIAFASLYCYAEKNRAWQDAELISVDRDDSQGVAGMPIGTSIAVLPLHIVHTWYRFQTADKTYVLFAGEKRPFNVTVHGHTKFAEDGRNGYFLDDAGKEKHLRIVEKIANH